MYRDTDKEPNHVQRQAIAAWWNLAPPQAQAFLIAEEKAMWLRLAAGKVYCAIAGDPVVESDVEVQKKIFTAAAASPQLYAPADPAGLQHFLNMMGMDHNSRQQQVDAARAKNENEQRMLRQAAYNTQCENMTGRLG